MSRISYEQAVVIRDLAMKRRNSSCSQFILLPGEIKEAAKWLESLPDSHEHSLDEMDWLDDARGAAMKLIQEIDAIFDEIDGRATAKK